MLSLFPPAPAFQPCTDSSPQQPQGCSRPGSGEDHSRQPEVDPRQGFRVRQRCLRPVSYPSPHPLHLQPSLAAYTRIASVSHYYDGNGVVVLTLRFFRHISVPPAPFSLTTPSPLPRRPRTVSVVAPTMPASSPRVSSSRPRRPSATPFRASATPSAAIPRNKRFASYHRSDFDDDSRILSTYGYGCARMRMEGE